MTSLVTGAWLWLGRQPIARKLRWFMMLTSGTALLLAGLAFLAYEWATARNDAERDLEVQANILAKNLAGAVVFGDTEHAEATLRSLEARPDVLAAVLFTMDDQIVAHFTAHNQQRTFALDQPVHFGIVIADRRLKIHKAVTSSDVDVGILYLEFDIHPLYDRLWHYAEIAVGVLALSFLVTVRLAAWLARIIAQPLLELAGTARQVSDRRDYTLRVVRRTDDEVGRLIDQFNGMLAQIQTRDSDLRHAHDDLETRVRERTRELQEEVSKRRRIELDLRDEKERLAVTLRSIGDGVIATDERGYVVLFNAVAEELTGWPQAQALGQPLPAVLQLLDPKNRTPLPDPFQRVLEAGATVASSQNPVLVARNGVERIVANSAAPIRDPLGQTIGIVLVVRDITEKERTAAELLKASKLESIGMLAGGIAHDFNNILTAIVGNLSLGRLHAPREGPLAKALQTAEKAATRAADLTRQLLTFSKGGTPVKQTASLTELIHETITFVLHGSNVRPFFDLPAGLWPVDVDVNQISQVLHNLALNALQAMTKGGVLHLHACNVLVTPNHGLPLPAGPYVRITVRDDGPGIAPENLSRIFDPYFTTKAHGTGLGLATSYSILKRHDGLLSVESILGLGATFHIHIPASTNKVAAPTTPPSPPPVGHGFVLVMDDEEPIRAVARGLLEHLGYEIVTANDGQDAIDRYVAARDAGRPFDAVLFDLTVPGGMGGLEALQSLRRLDPNIKAIVSSGYSEDPILANYRESGFSTRVLKPYRLEDLAEVLHATLGPPCP
jgi:PAS domain S-box-containing protein